MFSKLGFKWFIACGILLVLTTCKPALYFPSAEVVPNPELLGQLKAGRDFYIAKCGSCHTLILPEKFIADDWHVWVDKMKEKVVLSEKEKDLILMYLIHGAKSESITSQPD